MNENKSLEDINVSEAAENKPKSKINNEVNLTQSDLKVNELLEELNVNEIESTNPKTDISVENGAEEIETITKKLDEEVITKEEQKIDKDKEIITFDNVSLRLGKEEVLKNINLKIYHGEFVYLVGASGAGKSSIIKMIYREVVNTQGALYINGENVTNLKNIHLPKLRKKIGVVFQDYKLLKDKTIFQNVAYSLQVTRYPRRKIKERVKYILEKVGIFDQANKYPNQLSGGQQQRAAIARAIVSEPQILVADEPTGNLDPENALAIMEILERINNEGTTVVMATHDVGIVNNFPKRVVLLNKGKIVKEAKGKYIYE